MKLYIVRYPNRVELHWLGTQIEAKQLARDVGGTWEAVEVPTDKPGLLAFLIDVEAAASREHHVDRRNALAAETVEELKAGDIAAAPAPAPARAALPAPDRKCPRCAASPEAAAKIAEGVEADAFVQRALEAPAWFTARVFEALAERARRSVPLHLPPAGEGRP